MVNYSNSKVYKIQTILDSEIHEVYYGSTTKKYLSQRMDKHRSDFKHKDTNKRNTSVFRLFEKYGIDNCEIVLVELVNCNSKDELLMREKHFIQSNPCLNKMIPIRTNDERKQIKKESAIIYRQNNKEIISTKEKIYREKNKDILKAKNSIKCQCECGSEYSYCHKARHCKSKKHQDFINQNVI
ncbi:MAG: hypothetical protein GY756_13840 [bacterium]|nr:hypothetical protein [bacterium]